MPNHMLLMSFDDKSYITLFATLNRFFEYCIEIMADKPQINFCYVGTAGNDRLIEKLFFSGFMRIKFGKRIKTSSLSLIRHSNSTDIEAYLSKQDIVFIGGGNTENMLQVWDVRGFTAALNKLKAEDRLPMLAGVSAGGMYPFHSGLTDSTEGQYKPLQCLAWFKESFCSHSDSKKGKLCIYDNNQYHERLPAFKSAVRLGCLPSGYAVPDDCMLHFYDYNLVHAYTSVKDQNCVYVTSDAEQPITTFLLTRENTRSTANDVRKKLGIQSEIVPEHVETVSLINKTLYSLSISVSIGLLLQFII